MKVTKFVSRCIFEGLKVIIPITFIVTILSVLIYYMSIVLSMEVLIVILVIMILLFLAFVVGAEKMRMKD